MFKFSRRLVADLRFWRKEIKLRAEENEEWEKIEAEAENGMRHTMAGFAYYQTLKQNRAERLKLHKEQKSAMK